MHSKPSGYGKGAPDLTVELAGLRLGFDVGTEFLPALKRRYRLFLTRAAPDYRLSVAKAAPARTRRVSPFRPTVRDEGAELFFSRGDARLLLSRRRGTGSLEVWPNPYSFDAALRVLYSCLLARDGCLFLHAAAVRDGDGVYLLPGVSGSGKTTFMEHLGDSPVLGDEIIGLRRRGREFEAFSTPFWGNGKPPCRRFGGAVTGLFFLERGRGEGLEPLFNAEAQRRALRCLIWFRGQSGGELKRAWGVILRLARAVPAYRFSFELGRSPLPRLREALRA